MAVRSGDRTGAPGIDEYANIVLSEYAIGLVRNQECRPQAILDIACRHNSRDAHIGLAGCCDNAPDHQEYRNPREDTYSCAAPSTDVEKSTVHPLYSASTVFGPGEILRDMCIFRSSRRDTHPSDRSLQLLSRSWPIPVKYRHRKEGCRHKTAVVDPITTRPTFRILHHPNSQVPNDNQSIWLPANELATNKWFFLSAISALPLQHLFVGRCVIEHDMPRFARHQVGSGLPASAAELNHP